MISEAKTVVRALRQIISQGEASSQEDLRGRLEELGLKVTQSTISRSLKRLGAVKAFSSSGQSVYRLPPEVLPSTLETSLADLATSIVHNNTLIIIKTTPGSASLIALHLDRLQPGGILGTIAGDDTIFIAPPADTPLNKVIEKIRSSLEG